MSVYSGPETPESGLVLSIDLSNTYKSFKGANTTNIFWHPTPDVSGTVAFQFNGTGTMSLVTSGNYGGYDIKPTDKVYKLNFTTDNGCYYHGNRYDGAAGALAAGQTWTFSHDYYISANVGGYPQASTLLSNIEIYDMTSPSWTYLTGSSASAAGDTSAIGVWKRASHSVTLPSGATVGLAMQYFMYPGGCNPSRMANTGFILYKNPQVELRSFGSPFVANTRSNTQTVIDMTGINTVTANSLTYSSDGTYSFNGTSNYITMSGNSAFQQLQVPLTITAAFKTTASQTYHTIFGKYKSTINNQLFSLLRIDNGSLIYYISKSDGTIQGVSSGFTITPNNWYIASVIIDGSTSSASYQFVVNGVASTKTNFSAALSTTPDSTVIPTIGASHNGTSAFEFFTGSISNVLIHNRALSVEECKKLYNVYRGRFGI